MNSEHDLTDLEKAGFDIVVQHIKIANRMSVRIAIQYSKLLVNQDVIEVALDLAANYIAQESAQVLNEMEGKES